ncbi:MAG: YkgJ family cysteine cluster protein [Candidatus Riflebacteria bacterium]|nr:YkgJ family cysteine cluster protein [Candidatus Riflebacteria bacterium]
MTIPCFACQSSCCSAYSVLLNSRDIMRIKSHLGLSPSKFISPVPLGHENASYEPYSFSLGDKKRFLLAMKMRKNGCIFLLKFKQEERCGVHFARPNVCRCYPFSFEHGHAQEVPEKLCPSSWELTRKGEKQFGDCYANMQTDYSAYKVRLDSWNSKIYPKLLKKTFKERTPERIFENLLEYLSEEV